MVIIRAHTQREKNIKNETFYQISPEKEPQSSISCLYVFDCLYVFCIFWFTTRKHSHSCLKLKTTGRGVPRDHSDTVRSGNHMNIMSGFFIMY